MSETLCPWEILKQNFTINAEISFLRSNREAGHKINSQIFEENALFPEI
jgi:hypothetical protein